MDRRGSLCLHTATPSMRVQSGSNSGGRNTLGATLLECLRQSACDRATASAQRPSSETHHLVSCSSVVPWSTPRAHARLERMRHRASDAARVLERPSPPTHHLVSYKLAMPNQAAELA